MQASTSRAIDVAHNIQQDMQEISTRSNAVAQSVTQQYDATTEIAQSVARASRGTGAVVTVLSEVANASIGTRTGAETVLAASESVDNSIGTLRTEIEGFLSKVAV